MKATDKYLFDYFSKKIDNTEKTALDDLSHEFCEFPFSFSID